MAACLRSQPARAVIAFTFVTGSIFGFAGPGATPKAAAAVTSPPEYSWPRIGHDPGNSGVSADPAISSSNAAGLGVRWMESTGAGIVSSPVVAWNQELGETLVYVGNEAGYLTAFNQTTGGTVWSVNLGSEIVSSPLVEGGYVWVTRDYSPMLYKLDAATGAEVCSAPLTSTSEGSPTIGTPSGGTTSIYIGVNDLGTTSGPIYSVAESNCAVNWQFTNYSTVSGTWDPLSFATDATGRSLVLAGTADTDASIYAIDALTGSLVWSFKTFAEPGNTDTDVGAGVSVSPPGAKGFPDGVAYVPGEDGYMYALDLTTGTLIWDTYFGAGLPSYHTARATAALVGGAVVFGEADGVMALDQTTGTKLWSYTTNVESLSAAAGLGPSGQQVVAVTTVAGAFDVLDASSGSLLYSFHSPTYATSSMADVDGNLLVTSADGFVYDLAVGGGNGAPPATVISSPLNSGIVSYPSSGALTVHGSAQGQKIEGVEVAIQSGGSSGPWWNAETATWTHGFFDNQATLAKLGLSSTRWSFVLPVPSEGGEYRVEASAYQKNGLADTNELSASPGATNIVFTVKPAAGTARLTTPLGSVVAPGTAVAVGGSGFAPDETVSISLGSTMLATKTTSSNGRLPRIYVKIPANAAFGPAELTGVGASSGKTASAPIDILNSWMGAGYSATHPSFEPNDVTLLETVAPGPPTFLAPAWSDPLAAGVRTSLAVADDIGYYADDAGDVTAVDVRNGQPVWTAHVASSIDSSPALTATQVILGTRDDSVVALDRNSGQPQWSTTTTSPVESAPALSGDQVLVGSDDGTVYSLNAATGAVSWSYHAGGSVLGSPAVDAASGIVVVGDTSGAVTALSCASGSVLWQVTTGGPVTATASIYSGVVYVGSADHTVYAFSEQTGAVTWQYQTSGQVTTGGIIYSQVGSPQSYAVGASDGSIYLLNLVTGGAQAVQNVGGPVAGLAGSKGWITVTTTDGQVWGLKRSAEPIWNTSTGAAMSAAATVLDGVIYVGGEDQTLTAYTVPGQPIP